ncbi:signal peptidase I [Nocardioides sp. AX2bis]|uniref:signal peptidase I n=1 Tax=Nocardioides sp. AX2bis TaxID=2653157 RepID=UPI001358EA23|nr:signal peptidase I [Nocardioides sp. AX2bis]
MALVVNALSWVLAAVVLAIVVLAVIVPRVAGAEPYTVLTGSMTPAYPPGSMVVVRPSDDIVVGDAVTYQLESGEPAVVTHRVVGIGYDGEGDRSYTLQGDANEEPDSEQVRPEQIRGEVWYSLPWVGHLGVLVTPGQHQLLVYVAAGAFFAYAAALLWQLRRDRRREQARGSVRSEREEESRV